jgi:preprotein translocase subunit YajC
LPDAPSLLTPIVLAAEEAPGMGPGGPGGPPGGGGMTDMLVIFAIIFAIFYFLVIRPQSKEKKKREETLKSLKKHDRVVTTAGLHGVVVSATDEEVVLKVDENVRLKFDRAAIWQVRQPAGGDAGPAEAENGKA